MPLYRHEANVVFYVHIPKTGGTTVEFALRSAGAAEALRFKGKRAFSKSTLQHMHRSVYSDAIGRRFYDWAFTIVRNPYNRFASEYKMKVIDAGGDETVEDWAAANFARFHQFKYTRDNHIRPQWEFIARDTEIFEFESGLELPIRAAVDRLGLAMPDVPHAKRGSSGNVPASRRAVEMIAEFYGADFDQFGYDESRPDVAFDIIESR